MKLKRFVAAFFAVIALAAFSIRADGAEGAFKPTPAGSPPSKLREFQFTYHADIPVTNQSARKIEAWIPLPRDDAFQQVTDLKIDSPVPTRIVDQPVNGNRVAYLEASAPLPATIPVTVSFVVTRHEEAADMVRAARPLPEPTDGAFAQYLGPNKLVPVDGRIAQISNNLSEQGITALEQARVIYEYVTEVMSYDKSGTGWGHGDAVYACDIRRGNCTDFHSLFIGLARARGIPARFTIGFPLAKAKSGTIPGYHCWAEFYSGGVWVPIDASEAWKHPDRHAYYFGNLDADRVAFTIGRDLVLDPKQNGEALNYLIYPYVEVDGVAVPQKQIVTKFSYADTAP
ncbi:MAG TPA: transglutaminase domain-containing protein [Candidatus Binataceae bacterium]|nr:transglutaminase domain-containing protein [Candidatus Binataceae bacterium]